MENPADTLYAPHHDIHRHPRHADCRHYRPCARRPRHCRSVPMARPNCSASRAKTSAPRSKPPGSMARRRNWRAKQLWHWIYHRGVTDFDGDDRHRQDHAPLAGRAFRDRSPGDRGPRRHSTDGTRKWLLSHGRRPLLSRWCSFPTPTGEHCAFPARSAARSIAASVTPAPCDSCVTLQPGEIVGQVMLARDALGRMAQGQHGVGCGR